MTQEKALSILKTGANVFLTGEPGSGKSHTINEYVKYLREHKIEPSITASTGIASTHIGGMTIHSWSGLGIRKSLDPYSLDKIASTEYIARRIRQSKVLIIDEVSMLSPSLLDMVERVVREIKQNEYPFGGMQVVFVGDFFQLPPVSSGIVEDNSSLFEKENSRFAYESNAWEKAKPFVCYLSEQHRQDDDNFLSVLSAIRGDSFDEMHFEYIQERTHLISDVPEHVPKLFSKNVHVDTINSQMLDKIENDTEVYEANTSGTEALVQALEKGCLSPKQLVLKIGALVMFTKNNPREGFVNGTLGRIIGFSDIGKMPIVKTHSGRTIMVEKMEWTIEENGKIKARFSQVPLRLAWAMTIHKSQGMSLDEAVMDLSEIFEYGQGYVALSRVKRLSGLYILGVHSKAFQVDPSVKESDGVFRSRSTEADDFFSNMKEEEIEKLHDNFIKACDGKQKKKEKVSKQKGTGKGFDEIRKKFPNAFRPWSKEDNDLLITLFSDGVSEEDLAVRFERKVTAIHARLIKLELIEPDEAYLTKEE